MTIFHVVFHLPPRAPSATARGAMGNDATGGPDLIGIAAPAPLPSASSDVTRSPAIGVLVLALVLGGLITYKASSALQAVAKTQRLGTMSPKAAWIATADLPSWLRPLAGTANYFAWVGVALAFGLVLGALVQALAPERLVRSPGLRGPSGQLVAVLAGAPLMLCSCCVAPLFDGLYARTRRLDVALSLMFAAPGLNPAAIFLTFLLFPTHLAVSRLILALLIVVGLSAALGRIPRSDSFPARPAEEPVERGFLVTFATSLRDVTYRTMPAIALGVIASVVLMQVAPFGVIGAGGRGAPLLLVALLAVLVALPTFGEIPIALALLAAGASEAVALSVLVAGPIVNLPSLLTLRRRVSLAMAVVTGLSVYLVTLAGAALLA